MHACDEKCSGQTNLAWQSDVQHFAEWELASMAYCVLGKPADNTTELTVALLSDGRQGSVLECYQTAWLLAKRMMPLMAFASYPDGALTCCHFNSIRCLPL